MRNIIIVLSSILILGCNNTTNEKEDMGNFAHTVFFWLKNPDNKEDRAAFEKSLKYFINNSKYIKTKHIGTPAATNREVIDNSYTYSLLLTFETKEDHDAYQDEPNHKQFLDESMNLWSKVIVYDSENTLE
ncbi:Dabb family protein [Seonamhaeicola sp. MEBiC1930]|uniref:Dabb family protein n=1 Tax=Seonamhaeicola sp. MEBiC01930 TaxID=2976768 RepID=UPI003250DCC3